MKRIIGYLLIILILLGCQKGEDNTPSGLSVPEIAGINYRDNFGAYLGTIGTPNVRLSSKSNSQIVTYPIPCSNSFSLNINLLGQPDGSEKIWLVKAKWAGGVNSFSPQNKTFFEAGNIPVFIIDDLNLKLGTNEIQINTANLEAGFYKIYIQIENELLFDNLLIEK